MIGSTGKMMNFNELAAQAVKENRTPARRGEQVEIWQSANGAATARLQIGEDSLDLVLTASGSVSRPLPVAYSFFSSTRKRFAWTSSGANPAVYAAWVADARRRLSLTQEE